MSLAACHDTPQAFAPGVIAARTNADSFFLALEQRFTAVQRSPRFAAARTLLIRDALAPSRVFNDTIAWNGAAAGGDPPPNVRTLTVRGSFANNGHYVLAEDAAATLPARFGETLQVVRLEHITKGQYEWTTRAVGAVGSLTGDDLARVLSALISASATRAEPALRTDYRTAFPRTTQTVGRLLNLDTLRTEPLGDGTTVVTLVTSFHPERIAAAFPAYAKYIKKYVMPSRFAMVVTDHSNDRWIDLRGALGTVTVTVRATRDGHLAPLAGPPRAMPDSLRLTSEFFAKVAIFTVGLTDLVADCTAIHEPHERGWNLAFRHEPHWHLPLAMAHFMRGAMREPFEGTGAGLRYTLKDSAGAQTLLFRDGHIAIKESTVMKWLGGLGNSAVGEFAQLSEAEENRFDAEAFGALRADIDALLR